MDFIDLDGLGTRPKPQKSQAEKAVYLSLGQQKPAFTPMAPVQT